MKVIHISPKKIPYLKSFSIALGYFDGIHLGHQKVIKTTIKYAQNHNIKSAVFTFSKSPYDILHNIKQPSNFYAIADNQIILEKLKIDYYIIFHVSKKQLIQITPKEFVQNFLLKMGVIHVSCGDDFHFGKERKGKPKDIESFSNFIIKVNKIKHFLVNQKKISTSKIKQLLKQNKLPAVRKLLGRNFGFTGQVIHGKKVGRKIGYRTANIEILSKINILISGVFTIKIIIDNKIHKGLANVGSQPTFSNSKIKKIEILIFNFKQDIYNKKVYIEFIDYIQVKDKNNN